MQTMLPAYKAVGARRYRETSGLYWEDFEPGDVFEHRPGRTVLDVDNTYFTLLTLNIQQVHFDAAYAAKTEWKKMLVDSTFTLALLTGMSVRTVSAKVVANLGWDRLRRSTRSSPAIRSMRKARCFRSASPKAARPKELLRSRRGALTRTASR